MSERKYYVVEINTYNDSKKDSFGIYAYDSKTTAENLNEALAAYHGKLRTNRLDATCETTQCIVIDDYNKVMAQERFERNPEQPEPIEP